jgi:hypothetical protein
MAVSRIENPAGNQAAALPGGVSSGWWRCWGWFLDSIEISPVERGEIFELQAQLLAKEAELLRRMKG